MDCPVTTTDASNMPVRFLPLPQDGLVAFAAEAWSRPRVRKAPLAGTIAEELIPGPGVRTRDDLIAYIHSSASTVFHPCGTCRMGPDDVTTVVDASIFPNLTSGNTNAPVVMAAEKAADVILAQS